jgi:phage-related minor tail protein
MTMASAAALSIVLKAIDDASGVFADVADSADDMGDGISGAGKVAAVALGGIATAALSAAVALGGVALKAAMDFSGAQNDVQAKLGLSTDAAAEFGDMVKNVYKDNFGGSVQDVSDALVVVTQQLGNLPTDQLNNSLDGITENAFRIKDVFGVDVKDSVSTVRTLMEQFGLTSEQAFNFVTSGFQQGLDRSGDFLDTINEYSTQFANGGADAGQFFSLLESGLQGGTLGTDKAADAFKEFRVRIQDGSATTAAGLAQLGINSTDLFNKMKNGNVTAAEAFQLVLDKIRATQDTNVQMQAGVALLGTQFEDLGQTGALNLSLVGVSIDDLAGRTSALDVKYQNLGAVIEGAWRGIQVALVPLGDMILAIANHLAVELPAAAAQAQALIGQFVEATRGGMDQVTAAVAFIQANFNAFVAFLQPKMQEAIGAIQAFLTTLEPNLTKAIENVSAFIQGVITPLVEFWQAHWDTIQMVLVGVWNIIEASIKQVWNVISSIITIGLALLAGDWEGAWNGVQTYFSNTWDNIQQATGGAFTALAGLFSVELDLIEGAWSSAWGAVQTAAETAWAGITETIRAAVNAIVGLINGVIDAWNGLSFSVPSVDVGGKTFGGGTIGVPQVGHVPYLAAGGHILGGGLAVVGDRGPELLNLPRGATVAPLGAGMGGVTVVIQGNVYGDAEFETKVAAAMNKAARRGALRGTARDGRLLSTRR